MYHNLRGTDKPNLQERFQKTEREGTLSTSSYAASTTLILKSLGEFKKGKLQTSLAEEHLCKNPK